MGEICGDTGEIWARYGEIQARYGRDMRRYRRDIGEIYPEPTSSRWRPSTRSCAHISPMISRISPLYLPYISPTSPQVAAEHAQLRQQQGQRWAQVRQARAPYANPNPNPNPTPNPNPNPNPHPNPNPNPNPSPSPTQVQQAMAPYAGQAYLPTQLVAEMQVEMPPPNPTPLTLTLSPTPTLPP